MTNPVSPTKSGASARTPCKRLGQTVRRLAWAFSVCVCVAGTFWAWEAAQAADLELPRPHGDRPELGRYRLAWRDEFDGEQLSEREWAACAGERGQSALLPRNVRVAGGRLQIHLKREAFGERATTAGGVTSKREFLHGYYEARVRLPSAPGWHTSILLWKQAPGRGSRQEIAVCDHDSSERNVYSHNLNVWQPDRSPGEEQRVHAADLSNQFHVLGCLFTPLEVHYYFDGRLVGTRDVSQLGHDEQNIWLVSFAGPGAAGDGGTARGAEVPQPATVEFDYVRYFVSPRAVPAKKARPPASPKIALAD